MSDNSLLLQAIRELAFPGCQVDLIERVLARLKKTAYLDDPSLKPLRVKLLANVTTDYLADHLRLMLVRAGFDALVSPGRYGGLIAGLLEDEFSPVTCDVLVVILTHRDLQSPPGLGLSAAAAQESADREVDFWASLLNRSTVPTAVLSFDLPSYRILSEQDGLAPGGMGWHTRTTNLGLASRLPAATALIDTQALQTRVGATHWYDAHVYHMCKQPYAMEALPEIAHTVASTLAGLLGRGKKVLVLDLDNTLWGGVIGDDGLQGLLLGPETAEGEAFTNLQTYIKQLSKRGIILAVCSKNREEAARLPFREHSAMLLKEDDIACFVANFDDKAGNLRQIAKTLNVGLDSLVFVDDSPVERALIRAELPEVLVVELPQQPDYYIDAIEAAKAFPLRALTDEDLGRGASYVAMGALRRAADNPATDMSRFLAGLEPVAHRERVGKATVDRIVQLIAKTNQFRMNPSVFQDRDILASPDGVVALRLVDRLQDYGIVAVAVTRLDSPLLIVSNWVMSCRVFGRRLEHVMLEILRKLALTHACDQIKIDYVPSKKNVILPDLLTGLGFSADESGRTYRADAAGTASLPHHMQLVDGSWKQ